MCCLLFTIFHHTFWITWFFFGLWRTGLCCHIELCSQRRCLPTLWWCLFACRFFWITSCWGETFGSLGVTCNWVSSFLFKDLETINPALPASGDVGFFLEVFSSR
jgi:hypothetical protein